MIKIFFYSVLLRSAQYATHTSWENEKKYIREYRGVPIMNGIRYVWKKLDLNVDKRPHFYSDVKLVTKTRPDADGRTFFEFLKTYSIATVPGAVKGGNNKILGQRTQGGKAMAMFGGPVQTTHDDKNMTLINFAMPGHFFSGGYVTIRIFEEGGNVYAETIGFGNNNFAWFNEWFGSMLFKAVMKFNIVRYNVQQYTE
jgi:hypothetical protein